MDKEHSLPLSHCHVKKTSLIINRSQVLFHSIAIAFLIYHRASFLYLQETKTTILPWLLVFASELLLSFIWLLGQAFRWRPVTRTAFPERLPIDGDLPSIDVFICTADPEKEPTADVMNTVLSAMALDYPVEKLHVYLSDDGGSLVTLQGMREAWRFAKWWLPFCTKYGIKTRCPEAYFSGDEDLCRDTHEYFLKEKQSVKRKYEEFKENIEKARENGVIRGVNSGRDHPPTIEVINEDHSRDESLKDKVAMPLLVYVSREKRPAFPHHFKAGALNVLLRVSGLISNSPHILVLDCDMYCNDPSSAKRAMCFHLDPQSSPSLAFVQFPQRFHNISNNDIYDSAIRSAFSTLWEGLDGLQGPVLSGSGFYIKRECLCETKETDLMELKDSYEFIKSLGVNPKPNEFCDNVSLQEETRILASCNYENDTKWGKEVGFLYESVTEDFFTGFIIHSKGWTSVYCDPSRPQFLGSGITNLNDLLTQGTRWCSGLVEVGLSRYCPLVYRTRKMSLLQSICYAELVLFNLCYCTTLWCFATIPQLCLLNGISIYPKVSDPSFAIFSFIFISSLTKHLQEVLTTGWPVQSWINEQRIWMIKSITCSFYGSLDAILDRIGARKASFVPTNKVGDEEQVKQYQMGKFDFRTSLMFLLKLNEILKKELMTCPTSDRFKKQQFLVPMVFVIILNLASLVYGVSSVIVGGRSLDKIFVQVFISFYILVVNYPIIEGMVLRKDKGCIPVSVTFLALVFFVVFFFVGSVVFM